MDLRENRETQQSPLHVDIDTSQATLENGSSEHPPSYSMRFHSRPCREIPDSMIHESFKCYRKARKRIVLLPRLPLLPNITSIAQKRLYNCLMSKLIHAFLIFHRFSKSNSYECMKSVFITFCLLIICARAGAMTCM